MSNRFWFASGIALLGVVIGEFIEPFTSSDAGHAIAMAGLILGWRIARCRHTFGFALIPKTIGHDGEAVAPFWRCPDCGRTRAVDLTPAGHYTYRITGFDGTRAPRAAQRAHMLEIERTRAAIQRAGMSGRPE